MKGIDDSLREEQKKNDQSTKYQVYSNSSSILLQDENIVTLNDSSLYALVAEKSLSVIDDLDESDVKEYLTP